MNLARLVALVCGLFIVVTESNAAPDSVSPQLPQIPDKQFKITDYGATGDGAAMNTDAIAKTITACKEAEGGIVVVPAGKFLTGPFEMVSKMNLQLDEGATLFFTDDPEAFPIKGNRHRHGITAANCTDMAITGKGTIDGNGGKWWNAFRLIKGTPDEKEHPRRPNLIDFDRCQRILVKDVLLTNSPMFHLVPRDCDEFTLDGVRFVAPDESSNTDAFDPSGHNYLIKNCFFDVGDDCIAVKPQTVGERVSCANYLVVDCTFKHGHGLSIGGQTSGGMRGMTVRNCTFENTDAGIRLKAARGSGGLVEDLVYENITMKNVKIPILISSYYPKAPPNMESDRAQPVGPTTPIWRNVRISNVSAEGGEWAGQILGLPEMPVSGIVLTNVKLTGSKKSFQICNAKQIEMNGCSVKPLKGAPLLLHNAEVTGMEQPAAR